MSTEDQYQHLRKTVADCLTVDAGAVHVLLGVRKIPAEHATNRQLEIGNGDTKIIADFGAKGIVVYFPVEDAPNGTQVIRLGHPYTYGAVADVLAALHTYRAAQS